MAVEAGFATPLVTALLGLTPLDDDDDDEADAPLLSAFALPIVIGKPG